MTQLQREESESADRIPRWPAVLVIILVFIGAAGYLWLLFSRWSDVAKWGALGDSLGPLVGVVNSVALLVAIWSLALQRKELALQREEIRESRKVLVEQTVHAKEAAEAQRALAEAQRDLVVAQTTANTLEGEGHSLQTVLKCADVRIAIAEMRVNRADRAQHAPTALVTELDKQIRVLETIEEALRAAAETKLQQIKGV